MHLKSLTLRGFKSFASATHLQLEPGITCVVGPNGSGKSNVVDALAWVMGEQGAKSLRGGKMEDVIFAGTSARAPLGRAEVVLTIDNGDGALPIDYAEVTISRTMFRNGGSDYAINGNPCRLLDVQELLSDSGIGREMHVIVGQGQLDSVLRASPEERRGFVEEAAGVLKHRKRKEKALRKLDATEGNLTRLQDLLAEIRRQLKPLGRQAEVARRAAVVQADVRDARARLLADDVLRARDQLQSELADEEALRLKRTAVEGSVAQMRTEEAALEDALREDAPRMQAAQDTWYGLNNLRDRLQGTASLAAERVRNAAAMPADERRGRDPEELEEEAGRFEAQEKAISEEVGAAEKGLEDAITVRKAAEAAYQAEERRIADLVRAASDRREGLARLTGQVNTLRTRVLAAEEEIGRLEESRDLAEKRAERAQHEFTVAETQVAGLDSGETGLTAEIDGAEAALADASDRLAKTTDAVHVADRERAGLEARKEALEMGLSRKDGAGAVLGASERLGGVLGSVAAVVTVQAGYEAAVAAALGPAADAVAVDSLVTALSAVESLKATEDGRAGLVVGSAPATDRAGWPALPDAATYALDVVEAPHGVLASLGRLLDRVVVVDDLATARDVVDREPTVTAVTREGDVVGSHYVAGGSQDIPSLIEVQAAVDQAAEGLRDVAGRRTELDAEVVRLKGQRDEAKQRLDVAMAKRRESEAKANALTEKLAQLGSTVKAARDEATRLAAAITNAQKARDDASSGLEALEQRLTEAENAPEDEPDTEPREQLAETAKQRRAAETEARLALRTSEERARAISGRAAGLRRRAAEERAARERDRVRRERMRREGVAARAVGEATQVVLEHLAVSLAAAKTARDAITAARAEREQKLADVRRRLRDLSVELARLTDSVHRDEVARAEQRLRIEALETRALEEIGIEPDSLVTEYGPEALVPVPRPVDAAEDDPDPEPVPYVRAEQEKRLRAAEKSLALLGKVNPLALEEFSALEERHKFLSEQLEDLRKTRKDLLEIVTEVDRRVEQVFTSAWEDVSREFEGVFSRLFPGGEGRLILTDPSSMLTTGIEVEARPPGKKVKRLSLLSGGERSLVAVAFLVALFKARPSPFYILDEVEAALDDTNLGRLLEIYEELRENSQLIVITHQKRTMEVADALYGVSMRGDGVSAVISQRMREAEPA
ncbi:MULTISPECIES: chromosome segregation protein SMC [Mumia]|uniref:chromosome segregation protein SMC n=1 Tax=Mumia TaxID=1546255 RepID=UPI001420D6C8|nr:MULTISPECIES: chromosome segregation protein SMC [unclassified Mumia]QMW65128.1 chromosome segregation protein SMC [Mumia sp. ZJ1417]